jgi:hypothetical protein
MKMRISKFIPMSLSLVMLSILLFGCTFKSATVGKDSAHPKLRVLVDASKEEIQWWFPQGSSGFDFKKEHMGKPAADGMRARGWDVVELPRGSVVTLEMLKDFNIVIRLAPLSGYSESEAAAYQEAVASGARMLLIGSPRKDAVAEAFGLIFDSRSRLSPINKIIPHSLTTEIENFNAAAANAPPAYKVLPVWSIDRPWTAIKELPQDAVTLAWAGDDQSDENPVFGYSLYHNGYILFSGSALGFGEYDPGLRNRVLDFLEQHSSLDLQRPATSPLRIEATGPQPPVLVAPENGAILPQPEKGPWVFTWEPIPGVRKYQIIVFGAKAENPAANREIASASYTIPQGKSYIVDRYLRGWMWRVRAQDSDGDWGRWSPARYFDVEPRR